MLFVFFFLIFFVIENISRGYCTWTEQFALWITSHYTQALKILDASLTVWNRNNFFGVWNICVTAFSAFDINRLTPAGRHKFPSGSKNIH